jgi:hypothetical protein
LLHGLCLSKYTARLQRWSVQGDGGEGRDFSGDILRRLGNVLLLASVLIAGGWIVFAVEWLGAGLEEWERV